MNSPSDTAGQGNPPAAGTTLDRSDRTQKDRADDEGMLFIATDLDHRDDRSAIIGPGRNAPRPASSRLPADASRASAEETDLERRVLAHERILQTLIAHLAEAEPAFLERLHQTFVESMRMVSNEHDYTDTSAYAEEFIRAVVRLKEKPRRPHGAPTKPGRPRTVSPVAPASSPFVSCPVIQIRERAGIWEVTVDGRFHGQYSVPTAALDAVRALSSKEA